MPEAGFLRNPSHDGHSRVVFDGHIGEWLTRAQVYERVESFAAHLQFREKALGFHFPFNDAASLIAYLAAIEAGHAVVLLDPELDPRLKTKLIERFQPDFIVAPQAQAPGASSAAYSAVEPPQAGQLLLRSNAPHRHPIHPDLTLLISTSGSTGSPKLVRLCRSNLESQAWQLNQVLRNSGRDRTAVTAPIFNAYGLSVIHTMLAAGGSLVLSRARVVSREFWDAVRQTECTAIGGTPYFFQVFDRLDPEALDVPHLAKFASSGGRFPEALAYKFHAAAERRGGTLHLTYGQAESTRQAALPPELLPDACRSVGFAVSGGRLWIERDGIECQPMEEGELIYQGPNVMMGYATCPQDLAEAGNPGGRLATGDLGYRDARGLIYITGRKARFVKLNGWRVSLDDVEELLSQYGPLAAVNEQDRVVIYAERTGTALETSVVELAVRLHLHPSGFEVRAVGRLPVLASGKVDYLALSGVIHRVPAAGAGTAFAAGAQ